MLYRLHLAKVFTKIDLRNAYHQVQVKEGDEWKIAFRCREGRFEYQVCSQGPTNAPAMFQYFMNDILREYLDVIAVGILDDGIIFSATPAEHVLHVRSILEVLRANQLYAKVKKCDFDKDQMTFVGYLVSKTGIGMDPAEVSAILDWPTPNQSKKFSPSSVSQTSIKISSFTTHPSPPPSLPLPERLSSSPGLWMLGCYNEESILA